MMQHSPPTGPDESDFRTAPQVGCVYREIGFTNLKNVFLEPAKAALGRLNVLTAPREEIVRVILEETKDALNRRQFFDEYRTDAFKIAAVYAFWLYHCSLPDDQLKRLEDDQQYVFDHAGVTINPVAMETFNEIKIYDEHTRAAPLAPGPAIKTKLLETISRIVDHLYII
jgi:hypothetical protein